MSCFYQRTSAADEQHEPVRQDAKLGLPEPLQKYLLFSEILDDDDDDEDDDEMMMI